MSAMSELDAELRAFGTPYFDGDRDVWLETAPDAFHFVVFAAGGFTLGEGTLTKAQIESDCGRLVPMTD